MNDSEIGEVVYSYRGKRAALRGWVLDKIVEPISKMRLSPHGGVAIRLKMLIPPAAGLRSPPRVC